METEKIVIFIDGDYFIKASDYFHHSHPVRNPISLPGIVDYSLKVVSTWSNDNEYVNAGSYWFQGEFLLKEKRHEQLKAEFKRKRKAYIERQDEIKRDLILNDIGFERTNAFMDKQGEIKAPGKAMTLAMKGMDLVINKAADVLILITNAYELIPFIEKIKQHNIKVVLLNFDLYPIMHPSRFGLGRVVDHLEIISYKILSDTDISSDASIQKLFNIRLYKIPNWSKKASEFTKPKLSTPLTYVPDVIIRQSKMNSEDE